MTIERDTVDMFFYGTLKAKDVRDVVIGKAFPSDRLFPAQIIGYEVRRVVGEGYPMLVLSPNQQSIVDGVIAAALDKEMIAILDIFEGQHYRRSQIAAVSEGRGRLVDVYLPDDSLVAGNIWEFDHWCLGDKKPFIAEISKKDKISIS